MLKGRVFSAPIFRAPSSHAANDGRLSSCSFLRAGEGLVPPSPELFRHRQGSPGGRTRSRLGQSHWTCSGHGGACPRGARGMLHDGCPLSSRRLPESETARTVAADNIVAVEFRSNDFSGNPGAPASVAFSARVSGFRKHYFLVGRRSRNMSGSWLGWEAPPQAGTKQEATGGSERTGTAAQEESCTRHTRKKKSTVTFIMTTDLGGRGFRTHADRGQTR